MGLERVPPLHLYGEVWLNQESPTHRSIACLTEEGCGRHPSWASASRKGGSQAGRKALWLLGQKTDCGEPQGG
jgi:hypothetical protein